MATKRCDFDGLIGGCSMFRGNMEKTKEHCSYFQECERFAEGKSVIVTHGDGDGIISAAILKMEGWHNAEVVVTQPFLLDKVVIGDDIDKIVVCDIAVNNRDVAMTVDWAKKYEPRIVGWHDHHQGAQEHLWDILGGRLISESDAPSCASIAHTTNFHPTEWVAAANACDRPTEFAPTLLSERINAAVKVAICELDRDKGIVDRVQKALIDELFSGVESPLASDYAAAYEPLLAATKKAAEELQEVAPGILTTTLFTEKVDKTALFTEGYKKGPIVALQYTSTDNGEVVTTIATNRKCLNLVQAFGFKSGAPFRVTLTEKSGHGATHTEQLTKIVEVLASAVAT